MQLLWLELGTTERSTAPALWGSWITRRSQASRSRPVGRCWSTGVSHFRLPFSGWCHVAVIHVGEGFVALSVGAAFSGGVALLNALALYGGVPLGHLTDSLSACFRNRDGSYAGDYTSGYRELCTHLGVIATRNNRGVALEDGTIEQSHWHRKHRLEQQLIRRGSRDFSTEAEYRQLVAQVTTALNGRPSVQEKLALERLRIPTPKPAWLTRSSKKGSKIYAQRWPKASPKE